MGIEPTSEGWEAGGRQQQIARADEACPRNPLVAQFDARWLRGRPSSSGWRIIIKGQVF
jgi:hypothetical protein